MRCIDRSQRGRLSLEHRQPLSAVRFDKVAARTATEPQRQKMTTMLERMAQAAQGSLDPLETDVDFHLAILEASNNQFFYNMSPMIETALHFSIRFTNRQLKQRFASVEEHEIIYNAIAARDQQKAATETRELLSRALELMVE